ncbi:hypothetical protein J4727_12385 [Providencia rettgeri]|uniref:Uncharacterized protein n=1 Tax=Providencia rettgeri TaxID=587 RepID=A0A939SJD4_PRORE|nr:hypothetical protein [Providencia rettgeri]
MMILHSGDYLQHSSFVGYIVTVLLQMCMQSQKAWWLSYMPGTLVSTCTILRLKVLG